jgi:hypothetical protein
MVALFVADVVSAKDTREFILPDFDMIRIPQWAGRAEYFKGDFHAEGVWIPYMTYDNIGKPGGEFYPFAAPAGTVIGAERRPQGLSDGAYGVRLSYVHAGWDMSGFYYTANDPTAAFSRETPFTAPVIVFEPIHKRIHQLGATLSKDLGSAVFKAEAVYTTDRLLNVTRMTDDDGLVKQKDLDYILGLEWSLPKDTRFNLQFFQRWFPDHDPDMLLSRFESGYSILLNTQAFSSKLVPEVLFVRSLNRNDWMARAKLTWTLAGNWRLVGGVDFLEGPPTGLFGQFDAKDRVYVEARYNF